MIFSNSVVLAFATLKEIDDGAICPDYSKLFFCIKIRSLYHNTLIYIARELSRRHTLYFS